ncbi:MAG: ATP-binding protein, partial [Bacteroidota bacterium]
MVSGIDPKEFGHKSLSRNPLIFGLFERIGLVEQAGTGILRMKNAMLEHGLPEPVFSFKGMFTVKFYRPSKKAIVSGDAVNDAVDDAVNDAVNDTVNGTVNGTVKSRLIEVVRFIIRKEGATLQQLLSEFPIS